MGREGKERRGIIKPTPRGESGGFEHTVGALLSLSSSLSSLSYAYPYVCIIQSANGQDPHSYGNKWGRWVKKGREDRAPGAQGRLGRSWSTGSLRRCHGTWTRMSLTAKWLWLHR